MVIISKGLQNRKHSGLLDITLADSRSSGLHCCDCSCLGHSSLLFSSMSRLPLSLPLSDHVLVVVATAVVFQLHLEGRMSW